MHYSNITSRIGYLKRLELYKSEKPYNLNFPVNHIPGARQTNVVYEYVENISIADLRGYENDFHLDINGFQVFNCPFNYPREIFDDSALTYKTYCKDMEKYMESLLNADKVYIYDSQMRRQEASKRRGQDEPPITGAHVDQTAQSNTSRLVLELGLNPEDCNRYEIINLWRPLVDPCENFPLALCDYQSVDLNNDLEREDLISPHYHGEGYLVYHNPALKWYYLSKMRRNEVFLMKQSDSLLNTPINVHAAIIDSNAPPDAEPRESIEVRALVINSKRSFPIKGISLW